MIHQTEWTREPVVADCIGSPETLRTPWIRPGTHRALHSVHSPYQRVAHYQRKRGSDRLDDLNDFLERLVPDGDPRYAHSLEGPDDMPATPKCADQTSISIPIMNSRLSLVPGRVSTSGNIEPQHIDAAYP